VLKKEDDAFSAAHELGYPVVVKPRFSHYWNGKRFLSSGNVAYANSDDQLAAALRCQGDEVPPPLLQRFVPGRGIGISLMLGRNQVLCAELAHERLRDLEPTGSGSVLRRSV